MKCRRCGHENEPDYRFCENCGNALAQAESEPEPDELHVPSIFAEPVRYTGKYSDTPEEKPKRRVTLPGLRLGRKTIGIIASLAILLLIWVFASRYGRVNDEIPPVIQEYAAAVRAGNIAELETMILSTETLQPPNPESFPGFLRVMEIPGRLNESVRNLEVDLSHLLQDPAYISNLPVKLLLLEENGTREYRIGVETFDVSVGDTGATIDGNEPDEDGIFHDYLMGQYTLEYEINRFPLQLDATSPNLTDGMVIPVQLAEQVAVSGTESVPGTEPAAEGSLEVVVRTDAENARIRINGEDTGRTLSGEPIRLHPGDRLQIVDLWLGGVGLSEEVTVTDSGTFDLPVRYDTEEFRQLIYDRIRATLIEDAQMLDERNEDGFTTVTGTALEKAVDNVHKLINGNQYYAGTYDRIAMDPESFTLSKDQTATVRVIGLLTYVYQTYTIGTPAPNVDDLWRDDVVMAFDLVLEPDSGQWLVSDWGRTDEQMSGAAQTVVDIIQ